MTIYYKGMRVGPLGLPPSSNKKENTKKRIRDIYNTSFSAAFYKSDPKNLIVMYDIPEAKKKERDWFRRHLKKFGYIMIQRSVWVGPSPLPKEFLEYLKEIKIGNNFKSFKLAKSYSDQTQNI
jgi:CRISPR-associated endonuclease Cas2